MKLAPTDDTVGITVFNLGITLFTSEGEKVRRAHWVLCKLDKEKAEVKESFRGTK